MNSSEAVVSDGMRKILSRKAIIDLDLIYDEDIYCFGYTILFVMTGVKPSRIKKLLPSLMEDCRRKYSKKLVGLVSQMIE